ATAAAGSAGGLTHAAERRQVSHCLRGGLARLGIRDQRHSPLELGDVETPFGGVALERLVELFAIGVAQQHGRG
ncbi:MAG: hypothetical protein WAN22_18400, partial [Solirubrobacteraceae bacterium]